MNYKEITIYQLFGEKELPREKLLAVESGEKFEKLKQEINRKEKIFQWEKIRDEISANCSKLLNIPLETIAEKAWEKYGEVSKYLDAEKYGKEDIFLIPLIEHTVVSEHHPKIEVHLGEILLETIEFEIQLKFVFKGVILKITDGKIQGVNSGKCQSKASLSCEGIVLFEDESREFEF